MQLRAGAKVLLHSVDPRILIADEPTTALDVTLQAQVLGLLEESKVRGKAPIFISHDLAVVSRIADEVLVHEGEVVERGSADQVFEEPQRTPIRASFWMQCPLFARDALVVTIARCTAAAAAVTLSGAITRAIAIDIASGRAQRDKPCEAGQMACRGRSSTMPPLSCDLARLWASSASPDLGS
ncbi:ABC-type sulfate/molybdate transport systems ATPase subunit [Bradyrhizobium sp. GM6.1]